MTAKKNKSAAADAAPATTPTAPPAEAVVTEAVPAAVPVTPPVEDAPAEAEVIVRRAGHVPTVSPLGDVAAKTLIVTARTDGFRRAGRAWSSEPTEVEVAALSEAQIAALLAEPELAVVVVAE